MASSGDWPHWRYALAFSAAVLLFDFGACLASLGLAIEYERFAVGSYVLYTAFGFIGRRVLGWTGALATAAAAGVVDSTLGLGLAWLLGRASWPETLGLGTLLFMPAMMAIFAGLLAAGGALLASVMPRRRARVA